MVLGSRSVKNCNFQALETPSGDLGLQGSISGAERGRKSTFGVPFGDSFLHFVGYFSDVIVDVKTVDQKVTPKCKMDDIFKPKMEQNLIKNEDHWKSADMRLDRAGSIRLRVGPPQIAPKIQKKTC